MQSVTCLAANTCLTADPGVARLILVQSHAFVEIDNEIISTVILPSPVSGRPGLLTIASESMCTKYCLTAKSNLPRKKEWLGKVTIST